jgi:hypothetical protein
MNKRHHSLKFLIMSLLFAGALCSCVTEQKPTKKIEAAAVELKELEYLSTVQLSKQYEARFDLSGIVAVANRLFVVADKDNDNKLFEVALGPKVFGVKPRGALAIPAPLDLEGVDFCDGKFYLVNEANATFWIYDTKTKATTPILVDYDQVNEDPAKWKKNAGLEGIAVDCDKKEAYLLKERDPRLIIRFDLKKNQTMETFNFPETHGNDYADGKFENGFLYLLERNGSAIAKIDPESKAVLTKVSFRATAIKDGQRLYGPSEYGLEEALLLKKDEIWLGVDNNALEPSNYGKSQFGVTSNRPVIMKYKRPVGF